MRWRHGVCGLVILLALAAVSAVWAQGTTGTLSGKVVDDKGQPIAGAFVTLTSTYLQGPRTGATGVEGEFQIPYLPPAGDYKLVVEAEGFNKVVQSNIRINLGTTTTVDIGLVGGGTEIQVTARPPVVTLKETKVSTNLTQQELETIPMARSYQAALSLAPQVSASGAGAGNPSVAGSNSTQNIFLVNGLNTTDPVTGTFGSNLNFNFIREMEVDTGGFDAEYGNSTGGLFNVLTKTGTNEFHGEVFAYYTDDSFSANAHSTDLAVISPQPFRSYDYGFDVGGPILKDRLWFFVGYNPQSNTYHQEGSNIMTNIDPAGGHFGAVSALPYKYDDFRRIWSWSAKFNFRVNDKHNLEAAVFADPARMWNAEGPYFPTLFDESRMSRRYQGGWSGVLRWYATWTPKLFMEADLGYSDKTLEIRPWDESGLGQRAVTSLSFDTGLSIARGLDFGGGANYSWDDRMTNQGMVKFTWLVGKHELKFGGQAEKQRWGAFYGYTGGQYWQTLYNFNSANPFTTNVNDYKYWFVSWYQDPSTYEKANYYSLFLQDKWSLTDFLQVSAGVRWERSELLPEVGESLRMDSYSPRVGLSWDWSKAGKAKFYMHYGLYYDRTPMGLTTGMDAGHAFYQTIYRWGAPYIKTISGNVATSVNPGTEPGYTKEFIIGNTYELRPDLTLDVRGTFRELGRLLEDVAYVTPAGDRAYILLNPGTSDWPAAMANWVHYVPDYEKQPRPIRNYSAVTATLNKRFTNNWFVNASYTWSQLKGNFDNDVYGYGGAGGSPSASGSYDFPEHLFNQNQYGYLSSDRTHQVKAQGSYRFDFGLILGANFLFQSGRPMYKVMATPYFATMANYGSIFVESRDNAGRLPSTWQLDLHAEYDLKAWKTGLSFFLDLFNVTNNQAQTGYYATYYQTPNNYSDISSGNLVRDYNWGKTTGRQTPRYLRVGMRISF